MHGKMLSNMSQKITNFFKKSGAEVDKETHFVKRRSKMAAPLFVETLVMGCLSDPNISLERLCRFIKERRVKLSPQALDQRFNAEAVLLMKNVLSQAMAKFKGEEQAVFEALKAF